MLLLVVMSTFRVVWIKGSGHFRPNMALQKIYNFLIQLNLSCWIRQKWITLGCEKNANGPAAKKVEAESWADTHTATHQHVKLSAMPDLV